MKEGQNEIWPNKKRCGNPRKSGKLVLLFNYIQDRLFQGGGGGVPKTPCKGGNYNYLPPRYFPTAHIPALSTENTLQGEFRPYSEHAPGVDVAVGSKHSCVAIPSRYLHNCHVR